MTSATNSWAMRASWPQMGASTTHHAQSTKPVSLRPMKSRPSRVKNPTPPRDALFAAMNASVLYEKGPSGADLLLVGAVGLEPTRAMPTCS